MRDGFAGPEGEPSAGCSVAERNPQKPGLKGLAQIIFFMIFFIWAFPLCGRRLSGFTGSVF